MALEDLKPLFPDLNPVQFVIRQYCSNCIAHRLTKFGWEDSINLYEPRLLLMLSLHMPSHTRMAIILDAWAKAMRANDRPVIEFLELHFKGKLVLTESLGVAAATGGAP